MPYFLLLPDFYTDKCVARRAVHLP